MNMLTRRKTYLMRHYDQNLPTKGYAGGAAVIDYHIRQRFTWASEKTSHFIASIEHMSNVQVVHGATKL
jgi:hypothetical protein